MIAKSMFFLLTASFLRRMKELGVRSAWGFAHKSLLIWAFVVLSPSNGAAQSSVFTPKPRSSDFIRSEYQELGTGRQFDVGQPLLGELRFLQSFIVDLRNCQAKSESLGFKIGYALLSDCIRLSKYQLTAQYELVDLDKVADRFISEIRGQNNASEREIRETLEALRRSLLNLSASFFEAEIALTYYSYQIGRRSQYDALSYINGQFSKQRFCGSSSPHLFKCFLNEEFIYESRNLDEYNLLGSRWTLAAAEGGVPDAQSSLAWSKIHYGSNLRLSSYWSQKCLENPRSSQEIRVQCEKASLVAGHLSKQQAFMREVEAAVGLFALFAGAAITIDKVLPDLPPKQKRAVYSGKMSIPDANFQMYEICQNQKKSCLATCEGLDAGGVWSYNPPRHACRSKCSQMLC